MSGFSPHGWSPGRTVYRKESATVYGRDSQLGDRDRAEREWRARKGKSKSS